MSEERYFDTYGDYRDALVAVMNRAERELILFDPDLRESGIESSAALAALEGACRRATAPDSVRILVHDVSFIERDCPRLLSLCARFGHRMRIRITSPAHRNQAQPFAVADGCHLATRFHQDSARGKSCFDSSAECAKLLTDHEAMWESGQNGPSGIPLGI